MTESTIASAEPHSAAGRRGVAWRQLLRRQPPALGDPRASEVDGRGAAAGVASSAPPRLYRLAVGALLLLLAFAAARNTAVVWEEVLTTPALPQWDMAKYGLAGVRLAAALRQGDLVELLTQVNAMGVWPPVFPLLEAPAFVLFGYGFEVPRLVVGGLYLITVFAMFWAARAVGGRDGDAVAVMAAAWLAVSPWYQLFATLVMIEIPGVLLLLGCLGAYWRALERDRPGNWRLAWVLTTLLFFCKFNYGLMWLLPLGLSEARRTAGAWRPLVERAGGLLKGLVALRPGSVFLLAWALLLVAILVLPEGVGVTIAGHEIRATSLGIPVYVLAVLLLLRLLLRPRASLHRCRRRMAGLAPHHRQFVLWVALPIAGWMAIPGHTQDFFRFVANRSSDVPFWSGENFLFYPQALASHYSPAQWLGWTVLALAVLPWVVGGRLGPRRRALLLALVGGAVALLCHPYKLPRFFFTTAPLVWIAAALTLATGLRAAAERYLPPRPRRLTILLVAGAIAAATLVAGVDRSWLRAERAFRTVPIAVQPVVDLIDDLTTAEPGLYLLGSWNLLSPSLIEWHQWQRRPQRAVQPVPGSWRDLTMVPSAERLHRRALARPEVRRLAMVDLLPAARRSPVLQGFARETAWLDPLRRALDQESGFRFEHTYTFPAAGYQLRVFRRSTPPPGLRMPGREAAVPAP